uniref:breast cancer anti-estrogen resistance protein 1 isoform X1 n=1 Tax=Myxine glutinosa TaxID=7769 RepID=UPI00358EF225
MVAQLGLGMKVGNVLAKALYDNVSESPDELEFRKGDIVTVLEQNAGGLHGWWLCSLHGRQGIAPGNRLRLLVGPRPGGPGGGPGGGGPDGEGVYQVPPSFAPVQDLYQVPLPVSSPQDLYNVPTSFGFSSADLYHVPPAAGKDSIMTSWDPSKGTGPACGIAYGSHKDPETEAYSIPPPRVGQATAIPGHQQLYDFPPTHTTTSEVYDVPPMAMRGPATPSPAATVITRSPTNDIYNVLPCTGQGESHEVYDVPPLRGSVATHDETYDVPPSFGLRVPPPPASPQEPRSRPEDLYDVPPSLRQLEIYDIPPSLAKTQRSPSPQEVYDVPRELSRAPTQTPPVTFLPASSAAPDSVVYDIPPQVSRDSESRPFCLDADAALATLTRLQCPIDEIGDSDALRIALADLCGLAEMVTSRVETGDRMLYARLSRQVSRLLEAASVLEKAAKDSEARMAVSRTLPDEARQLAIIVRANKAILFRRATLPSGEAVVHKNPVPKPPRLRPDGGAAGCPQQQHRPSSIQSRPLPSPPRMSPVEGAPSCDEEDCSWLEDYDYVHLQGKEDFEKEQKVLMEKGAPHINKASNMQEQLLEIGTDRQPSTMDQVNLPSPDLGGLTPGGAVQLTSSHPQLAAQDRALLRFYAAQCQEHAGSLRAAVGAFGTCVRARGPPRLFVAHGKRVVLAAHRLVFVGDALARAARRGEVRDAAARRADVLCGLLHRAVAATKAAALAYPEPGPVQEMVEGVAELAQQAGAFTGLLAQLAAL